MSFFHRLIPWLVLCLWLCSAEGQQASRLSFSSPETQVIFNLIKEKKWQEALEKVKPLVEASPDSEQVLLIQVAIYQGMGRHAECQARALDYLAKYESSPNRDQVLYIFANSLYQSGKKREAISYMEVADQGTKDPNLKKNITFFLSRWRSELSHIGIRLGGKPPASPEEKQSLKSTGLRILEMALEDYHEVKGEYPQNLQQLIEGDPPILRNLPEDPFNPGKTFEYVREGDGYRIPVE